MNSLFFNNPLEPMEFQKHQGFTMIELIMVITMIGVLSFYASTLMETNTFDERYYADDVVSGFRYAQKFALSTGCLVKVTLNNSGFALKSHANCTEGGTDDYSLNVRRPWASTPFVNQAPVPRNLVLKHNSGAAIDDDTDIEIIFYPQGWACSASGESTTNEEIQLVGTSATRVLTIVCSTGFVYVT